jgi:hypothetical protein
MISMEQPAVRKKKKVRKPLFPGLKSRLDSALTAAAPYRKLIFSGLALVLGLVLMISMFRNLMIMLVLIALASVSMIYNRWVNLSLGIELITLATVVAGIYYGTGTGILVGILTLLAAELVGGRMDPRTVVSFIGITVVGALSASFEPGQIKMAGIMMVVVYDLIIIPGYLFVGSNTVKTVVYGITHIVWNVFIFLNIAPVIVSLMVSQ